MTNIIPCALAAIVGIYLLGHVSDFCRRFGGSVIFLIALTVGLFVPDLDLLWTRAFPALGSWLGWHRSALTHSALPVIIVAAMARPHAAAGLAMALAMHLAADCFPRAWSGFSYVRLPFGLSLGSLSIIWLGFFSLISAHLGISMIRSCWGHRGARLLVYAVVLGVGGFYTLVMERSPYATTLLAGSLVIAFFTAHPKTSQTGGDNPPSLTGVPIG